MLAYLLGCDDELGRVVYGMFSAKNLRGLDDNPSRYHLPCTEFSGG